MKSLVIFLFCTCFAYTGEHETALEIMNHWKSAQDCHEQNKLEEAINEYSTAIFLEESHLGERQYDIYNDRGTANFLLGNYQEALEDFDIVLNRASFADPLGSVNIARALKRRAETYIALSIYEKAAEDLESLSMIEHFISKIDTLMKKPNFYSQLKDKKVSFDYIQGMNGGSFSFLADSFEVSNLGYQNEGFYQSPWQITLVKHSQENIDKKRKASKDKLNEANLHAYDMARGALNLQAGEFAHHLVQGSSCFVDSLKYSREASRMEKENRAEETKR